MLAGLALAQGDERTATRRSRRPGVIEELFLSPDAREQWKWLFIVSAVLGLLIAWVWPGDRYAIEHPWRRKSGGNRP